MLELVPAEDCNIPTGLNGPNTLIVGNFNEHFTDLNGPYDQLNNLQIITIYPQLK